MSRSPTSQKIHTTLVSMLTVHINERSRVDDAAFCKQIAAYFNALPMGTHFADAQWDFVNEFGEDSDYEYQGRDEFGEKQYAYRNEATDWNNKIRIELARLGYYQRHLVNAQAVLDQCQKAGAA